MRLPNRPIPSNRSSQSRSGIDPRYASSMPGPGDLAPLFDIEAHDGSRVSLADLAGKYVLLWFYPEADTPG